MRGLTDIFSTKTKRFRRGPARAIRCRRTAPNAARFESLEGRALLAAYSFTGTYSQDFNSLGTANVTNANRDLGGVNAALAGWAFHEIGSNANTTVTAGTGSGTGGDTYHFGLSGNTDRALGGLLSGSLTPSWGFQLTNDTGALIDSLDISYTGETWRIGTANRSDRIDFQYSLNATSLTDGTWIDFDDLDYANPGRATTGSGSVLDSALKVGTLSSLGLAAGATMYIRWTDFNASGSDDGMAIDDFSLGVGTPTVAATVQSPTQSAVTATGATLGGTVSSDGGGAISERGIVYSLTSTNATPVLADVDGVNVFKVAVAGTTGAFTTEVTGLSLASGYTYRAFATNSAGTAYSATDTFTTLASLAAPEVTGGTAIVTSATSAVLSATVVGDGGAAISERGYVYSLTTANANPTLDDVDGVNVIKVTVAGTTGTLQTTLTGLGAETGYSFKAFATNSQGTTYTSVGTFTTDPLPTTLAAGDIAVIGYNTSGTPDVVTFLVLTTLNPGTVFFITDNEVTAAGSSTFTTGEGTASFTVKPSQTIAAGTVITVPMGNNTPVSTTTYDWSAGSTSGLSNNGEEILVYTAASLASTEATAFLFGLNIGTGATPLPAGLTAGTTFLSPNGAALRYKPSGAVYSSTQAGLLAAIGDTATNWEAVAPSSTTDWTFTVGVSAPTVTSPTSASVVDTTATLGGSVLADGGDTITERGILYAITSTDATPTLAEVDGANVIKVVVDGTTGSFTTPVTGLVAGTAYSFRAYATNGQGTSYTSVGSFTTLIAPSVSSPTVADVATTSATLGGTVDADGGSSITERGILYALTSTDAGPTLDEVDGVNVIKVTAAGTTGLFTAAVTGLASGSGYSYRAFATNAIGTSYSAVDTFTTSTAAAAPSIGSPTSADVVDTTATLGGTITSDGGEPITERGVVFSVTSTNADPVLSDDGITATKVVATGTDVSAFTAAVTGLSPATSYTFKAYATNSVGTTYTATGTFTTSAELFAPAVAVTTTSVVTAASARLASDVTSDGGATITTRGFVYSVTSTNAAPEIGGTGVTEVTVDGSTGALANTLTGLSAATGYTVRAFATNTKGTTYGEAATFTTAATAAGPGLLFSEILANPAGSDLAQEYVEFVATRAIDFTVTPYSVVFTNNGTATINGWIAGGGVSYGFAIAGGSVNAGDVVYVGGSGMAPTGVKLRVIDVTTTAGDRFGSSQATGGVLGNGGGAVDGVAVFDAAIASLTSESVPVDAVFYGTGLGTAVVSSGTAGYQLPVNDAYAGGKLQTTSVFQADAVSGSVLSAAGIFNTTSGVYSTPRTWTVTGIPTDSTAEITLQSGMQAPVVESPTQATVTSSSATLGGTVTSSGSAAITERGIVYAPASANADPTLGGTDVTAVTVAGTFGTFATSVSGLTNGVTYAYKAYATNADGQTAYTAVDTFTTLAAATAPAVTAPVISALGGTTASLLASVTSDGGAAVTDRGIVYALASENATPTIGGTGSTAVAAGTGTGDFTAALTGLTAGGSYVFRAYATNSSGTTYSDILALSTPQPFTAGNLVVLRVGDGTTLLDGSNGDNDAANVALVELTTAGAIVQTIPLPSAGPNRVVLRGNSTSEGVLSISGDGQSVTFGAYRADLGNLNPTADAIVPRVIGRVSIDGSVDTSQALATSDGYQGDSFRSVVTNDGTSFWLSGAGNLASGGVRYVASTSATTSTSLNPTAIAGNHNTRQIMIVGGDLFVSSGSAVPGRTVWQVGAGLPTTADQTLTPTTAALSSGPQYQSFYFADLDATADWNGTGFDTFYAADASTGALEKFAFAAGAWTTLGTVLHTGIASIAGVTVGSTVTLYVSQATAELGTIATFVDATGYNAAMTSSFADLATPVAAGLNYAFRGLSFVPQNAPEPGATQLAVTTTPANHTYGDTFGLVVEARDGANVLDASYTGNVTVTIATGSGTLAGTTTVAAVGGVATFSGLSLSAAGAFTFTVSASGLTAASTGVTVAQKTLTVTAENATRDAGLNNPAFTYTVTGFVSGETAGTVLTGSPSLTTTATSSSPAGDYTITAAVGTLAAPAGNYAFQFVNGTLTVSPAAVAGPRVVGAFVKGSSWNASYATFTSGLSSTTATVGGSAVGWRLADGAGQLANSGIVSWNNVNRITLAFDRAITTPAASALTLIRGRAAGDGGDQTIVATAVSMSADGTVAQWTVPTLVAGKYIISVAAAGITDTSGNRLDGEWTTSSTTYAAGGSGNGTAGGAFNFFFNVLAGDINASGGVSGADFSAVKNSIKAAIDATNYRRDVNGSNAINALDVTQVKNLNKSVLSALTSPTAPAGITSLGFGSLGEQASMDDSAGTVDGISSEAWAWYAIGVEFGGSTVKKK